ncbi:SRPBCC domain-containing protein [candidate division KSB1 bacterium]|nr:SRPBCC domain-containing protein [candidate division KSB1 bacterium]
MAGKAKKLLPLGRGKIGFKVANSYAAPAAKVWAAITLAKHTQSYFVGKVTGDFSAQLEPVVWHWKRWGSMTQWPTVFQSEKKLEFLWEDHTKKYLTTVTFTLKKKGKLVELEIHERGWKQAHLKNAFSNCEGWTTFLAYLKSYLMHGKDLRHEKD